MPTWHRLGHRAELEKRVPFATKLDRHAVAVFLHDGQFRAIGNSCNHHGGPLCDGPVRGEYVTCPWHGWEYSVVTGKGPEGYDEEQVPVFAVEQRPDGVYEANPRFSTSDALLEHALRRRHPELPKFGAPDRGRT